MTNQSRILSFDKTYEHVLRGLWFLGDVHGSFTHIAQALLEAERKPDWLVFLGDIDIDHRPLSDILAPLHRNFPLTKVALIHGNHDADTHDHWNCAIEGRGEATYIHANVVEMNGVRVAGMGGNFMGRIWAPPGNPTYLNYKVATSRGSSREVPASFYKGAIYPDDFDKLAKMRADILLTHEAPACHPYGFAALDELALSLGVVRSFHGHQHDDLSDEYMKTMEERGYDARGVNFCSITNGLGERILEAPKDGD